VYLILALQ